MLDDAAVPVVDSCVISMVDEAVIPTDVSDEE